MSMTKQRFNCIVALGEFLVTIFLMKKEKPPKKRFRRYLIRVVMVFLLVTYVIPDIIPVVTGDRCVPWLYRDVDDLYLTANQLTHIGENTVTQSVPHLPGGFAGLALPGLVALTDEAGESTVYHEMVHQYQLEDEGFAGYMSRYMWDWYKGRYQGCSVTDAYKGIRYEVQARSTTSRALDLGAPSSGPWFGDIVEALAAEVSSVQAEPVLTKEDFPPNKGELRPRGPG